MDVPDELAVLKEAIIEFINQCHNPDVLDIILQLIQLL